MATMLGVLWCGVHVKECVCLRLLFVPDPTNPSKTKKSPTLCRCVHVWGCSLAISIAIETNQPFCVL